MLVLWEAPPLFRRAPERLVRDFSLPAPATHVETGEDAAVRVAFQPIACITPEKTKKTAQWQGRFSPLRSGCGTWFRSGLDAAEEPQTRVQLLAYFQQQAAPEADEPVAAFADAMHPVARPVPAVNYAVHLQETSFPEQRQGPAGRVRLHGQRLHRMPAGERGGLPSGVTGGPRSHPCPAAAGGRGPPGPAARRRRARSRA